jgi:hypothetical protein
MKVIFSIFLLLALKTDSEDRVTGYSNCVINLLPVAVGPEGVILCKTYFEINTHGGQMRVPVELGWLAISANGVWEYRRDVYLDFDQGTGVSHDDSLALQGFNAPFTLRNSPGDGRILMEKYRIDRLIGKGMGRNSVSWTKSGIYKNGARISKNAELKTVMGISNDLQDGTSLHASFYYQGIAIFKGGRMLGPNDDGVITTGPVFLQGQMFQGEKLWMDLYSIDAIAILKE